MRQFGQQIVELVRFHRLEFQKNRNSVFYTSLGGARAGFAPVSLHSVAEGERILLHYSCFILWVSYLRKQVNMAAGHTRNEGSRSS